MENKNKNRKKKLRENMDYSRRLQNKEDTASMMKQIIKMKHLENMIAEMWNSRQYSESKHEEIS